MIHWRQVFPWVSQAWPVLALIPAGLTHSLAIGAFPGETVIVNKLADISQRLEHASVGGFKFQALGVLLAIYGAVTSVFA